MKQPTTETMTQFNTNVFIFCRRGSMLSTAIFVYAATSPVNGYFGGSLYAKQGGKQISMHLFLTKTEFSSFTEFATLSLVGHSGRRWIKQMFIGAFMIPAMVCGTAFFINFIAIYYHASRAIPFGTMVGSTSWCCWLLYLWSNIHASECSENGCHIITNINQKLPAHCWCNVP